ncbi:MAG: hypothetical protein AAFR35_07155 [Pseudomonadota bacterium]
MVTSRSHPLGTMPLRYRGLRILMDLNLDRLLYVGTIVAALMLGVWLSHP